MGRWSASRTCLGWIALLEGRSPCRPEFRQSACFGFRQPPLGGRGAAPRAERLSEPITAAT